MLVVDASALVELISGGPRSETVGTILADDGDWWAPEHLTVDVASGLRGLWLGGYLTEDGFRLSVARLAQTTISFCRTGALLPRIVDLARRTTTYDAAYLALAEALECPLLTLDRRLRSVSGVGCTFVPEALPPS